ncbi:transposase [uncultured Parasutterella sp.]|uniref:IS1634 family transposase n=1 Tax=uncultured Parasutterella sp. TaxID=1263098 RepID=UPI0025B5E1EF|nr:transposase [uncultured Parasutterella sp.]
MQKITENDCSETIVRQKRKNGVTYVYKRIVRYNPAKRNTEVISSKLLGKLDASGILIPNRPKKAHAPVTNKPAPTIEKKIVGISDILKFIAEDCDIEDDLYASFKDDACVNKILDVANYWVANPGQSLSKFEGWQRLHQNRYGYLITEDIYHNLFCAVGADTQAEQLYFKARSKREGKCVLAYDTTTISTYGQRDEFARYGFNKDAGGLPVIKLLTLFSLHSHQPIAFRKQPGNYPDVISLTNALKELSWLDMDKVELVMDQGFYSENNLTELLRRHVKFLCLADRRTKWVSKLLDQYRDELDSPENFNGLNTFERGYCCLNKRTFGFTRQRGTESAKAGEEQMFEKRIYTYLYLDTARAAQEEQNFYSSLMELKAQMEENRKELTDAALERAAKFLVRSKRPYCGKYKYALNKESFNKEIRKFGCFALVSNQADSTFETLRTYRRREHIEDIFELEKDCLDGRTPRVWEAAALEGRFFCQFIALGLYCELYERIFKIKEQLKEDNAATKGEERDNRLLLRWLQSKSLKQILDYFSVLELTGFRADRNIAIRTEVTKRDQLFLKLLGMKNV